jgi:hypothetical protein
VTRRATLPFGLAVLALAVGTARPTDVPSADDLILRAIAVHGGRDALATYPSLEMRGTYESFGRGAGRRSDLVCRERADGAYRREITFEFRGRKITPIELYDGEVVKRRFFRGWDDLPVDEAAESAAHRLTWLLTLDPAEARVEGQATEADVAVWSVSVPDGRDRAVLHLAQDDGRLVALDYPGTSAEGMGTKEAIRRKLVYRDYRNVDGLLLPFDVESFEDGQPDTRLRYDTVVVLEKFDPAWLRAPDPTRRFIPSEELAF